MKLTRLEVLAEHEDVKWVIQVQVTEADGIWGLDIGDWRACTEVPEWLFYSEDRIAEHFKSYIAQWPDRKFRLHKSSDIKRYETYEVRE